MRKKANGGERAGQKSAPSMSKRDPAPPLAETRMEGGAALAARPTRRSEVAPKSLMKTSELGARGGPPRRTGTPKPPVPPILHHRRSHAVSAVGREQKIEERVAAASEELAAAITEAASAAEELRRSMEQIASGAEEAASASQETLAVATSTATTLVQARDRAQVAQRRTEALQGVLADTANQIATWANNIKHNGERQAGSVVIMGQLSEQAISIGDVTKAVSQVSDETNLLALNAAIEAARAGDHGRGFAVVADEVRALAETSERGARDVQHLAAQIQEQVKSVAAMINRRRTAHPPKRKKARPSSSRSASFARSSSF
jgi:methyl-accepting chemotaxis protein